MQFQLAVQPCYALDRLNTAGFEAYVVGGCVRDLLRGVAPHDYDICTSAMPEQITAAFSDCRTILTGVKHGTVTVILNGMPLEITTYRLDGGYADGRHPDSVSFTADLIADLARRDFTMNAIAYHPSYGFTDPFGGRNDLERGMIRCVGQANLRFREDALRMLRAIRFEAQLGFSLDPEVIDAIRENAGWIRQVSRERIREELIQILLSPHPVSGTRRLLCLLGQNIFPGCLLPDETADSMLAYVPAVTPLRLTAFLSGTPDAEAMLTSLRFSKRLAHEAAALLQLKHNQYPLTEAGARRLCHDFSEYSQDAAIFYDAKNEKDGQMEALVNGVLERGEPFSLSALAVDGKRLCEAGLTPGKEIGRILEQLLDWVMLDPARNQTDLLLEYAKKLRQTP
ncbi:MAG: hypothetical protein DBY25_02205 [Clostridiales bacterium]|nr:MAG: hypothetical protein DBY25_02205 [Clostridiales bacterium]